MKCWSYFNFAHLFKCRANFLCKKNLTVGKVSGSQLTCSTWHLTSYLRICRAPSAPDVEGVIVCSSRVHSRFVLCRAVCVMVTYLTLCLELFEASSLYRHFSSLTRTPTATIISFSEPGYHVYVVLFFFFTLNKTCLGHSQVYPLPLLTITSWWSYMHARSNLWALGVLE